MGIGLCYLCPKEAFPQQQCLQTDDDTIKLSLTSPRKSEYLTIETSMAFQKPGLFEVPLEVPYEVRKSDETIQRSS